MNRKQLWIIIVISTCCYGGVNTQKYFQGDCCEEYCYSSDKERPQIRHMSSVSAYQIVKGNSFAEQSVVPNCKPARFWMLSRHGTRLPELEEIKMIPYLEALRDQIIENYEVKKSAPAKGGLCEQDLQLLKDWSIDKNITEDKAEFLVAQGWNDLKQIAMDYKISLPGLLGRSYSPYKYLFRHTGKQRTEASMKAFAEGLFGEGVDDNLVMLKVPQNNTLLIPMGFCTDWKDDFDRINDPGQEVYKFIQSPLVVQTLNDISKRLGFEKPLTFKQASLIYNMCGYEAAWFLDKPSPWCVALTLDQIKIIEYENDLFYHYRSGYGENLNFNLPCELIQDLLTRFNSTEEPLVTAYFSHSTMIQMVATALGLFRDSAPISHSNYYSMENRKWRSSKMDPFAANFAVVKYDCSGNVADPSSKVKFFLNQKPLQIEGCTNGLCKFDDIVKKYERFLNADCLKTYCTRADARTLSQNPVLPTLAAMVYNMFH